MPKRRTFEYFLASLEDKLFFAEKEDMSFKRRTYGKPIVLQSTKRLFSRMPREVTQLIPHNFLTVS